MLLNPYRFARSLSSGDPYWSNVVSLLHFDGANGATSYIDEVPHARVWNVFGNAKLSTAQSKFGSSSLLLDGTGDYITNASPRYRTTTDFTVQGWVYPVATPALTMSISHISAGASNGLHIHRNASGYLVVDNGLVGTTAGTITIPLNTWTHIEVTRSGSTIRGFVNGVQCLTHTAQDYGVTSQWSLGSSGIPGTADFNGYLDDFAYFNSALHTADFTPPVTALVDASAASILHFDGINGSTTITDAIPERWVTIENAALDTDIAKFGSSSCLFSAGRIALRTNASFSFTAGGTVEFFIRPNIGIEQCIFCLDGESGVHSGHLITLNASGTITAILTLASNTASSYVPVTTSGALTNGAWNHVAVTYDLTTLRVFINGVLGGSAAVGSAVAAPASRSLILGGYYDGRGKLNGRLDEFRMTSGVARYTSDFTPPTEPFPNTGSSYDPYWDYVFALLHCDGADGSSSFIDETGKTWTTARGTPVISTTAGTMLAGSSLRLPDTNSAVKCTSYPDFVFLGDFTVETTFYPVSVSGAHRCVIGSSVIGGFQLGTYNGKLAYWLNGTPLNGSGLIDTGLVLIQNAKNHIALYRSNGVIYASLNGVQSVVTTPSTAAIPAGDIHLGYSSSGNSEYGYWDEVRITDNISRYNGNFIPSSRPFPKGSNSKPATYDIEYLLVAGGGGVGANRGGGGGAGGVVNGTMTVTRASTSTLAIAVGAGGIGAVTGTSGGNTSLTGATAAVGGGRGAGADSAGAAGVGGSGGGGATETYPTGAVETVGQGYAGGNGNGRFNGGGGGGGAGAVGGNASGVNPGIGGDGTAAYSDWGLATGTGHVVSGVAYFAGGGGGGADNNSATQAAGGKGGGGAGERGNTIAGANGLANTGGGAGGSGGVTFATSGGLYNGGSGIAIVRYAGSPIALGGKITVSGGYTYHVFKLSGVLMT